MKRTDRAVRSVVLATCMLLPAGCRTGSSSAGGTPTVAPDDAGPRDVQGEGHEEGDSIDAQRVKLERLRRQRAEKLTAAADPSFAVCEDLCSLMANICQVKEKLCRIADKYPGQESYQALCREAQHECREAETSCVECTESEGGGC